VRTLVICEKPDAAARVARALDEHGQPSKQQLHGSLTLSVIQGWTDSCVLRSRPSLHPRAKGKPPVVLSRVDFHGAKNEVEPKKSARLKNGSSPSVHWQEVPIVLSTRVILTLKVHYWLADLRHACLGADSRALRMSSAR